MGKKGALLREQKKKAAVYTFTAEQLAEHDQMIINEKMQRIRENLAPKAQEEVQRRLDEARQIISDEWDARKKEFYTDDSETNFYNVLQYLLCVSTRVLIERFRWKPIPKDGKYDRRNRIVRFSEYVTNEINQICSDESGDVRRYAAETYEKYGVRFKA